MITENYILIDHLAEKPTEKRIRWRFFDVYARYWMSGGLILADLFCLFVAILLAVQLRWLSLPNLSPAYDQAFTLLAVILVIKFYRAGLYPGIGLHYIDELRNLVTSLTSTFLIVLAVTFLLQTSLIYSRLVIFSTWIFSILLIPLGRYMVRRFLISLKLWGVPVVIIGSPGKAQALARELRIHLHHGIRPALVICDEYCQVDGFTNYPVFSLESIKKCAHQLHLHDALILVDDLNNVDSVVDRYRFVFNRVTLVKDQAGKYGLNNLQPLDFATALGLQVKNHLLSKQAQILKRLIDLIGSFIGLLLLAPFLGLVALVIKLDSPGRIFYRQARIGKGGKTFYLLKFRTMHMNADEVLKIELERNPTLRKEWDCYQKLKDDPRITKFGKFLRKFSLDELPQLWNIVRGDMSLVGPRPIMLNQHQLYGPYYKDYVQVIPGMTGLWQVSGRNQTSFAQRADLDNEYIQRWSLWMDVYILFKTIKVVIWQNGAY